MDTAELVRQLLEGRRRAIARVLSLVEDGDAETVRTVASAIHPHTGGADRLGVTGPPGVGKSTFTSALTGELRRQGRTVAVIAVDPSSPFSGGALLGDRVRMGDHAADDGVYIRSMASRGHLGGLSWAASQAMDVLDAAGFDTVVVETVGVGQAEVEIASLADTTIVLQAPGMGDAIQAAKAGVLEIADIHVVNKADRPGADRTARELRNVLDLGSPSGWAVPVLLTTADSGEGVAAVVQAVQAHLRWARSSGERQRRRDAAAGVQIREILLTQVRRRVGETQAGSAFETAAAAVASRRLDPYAAADSLLDSIT